MSHSPIYSRSATGVFEARAPSVRFGDDPSPDQIRKRTLSSDAAPTPLGKPIKEQMEQRRFFGIPSIPSIPSWVNDAAGVAVTAFIACSISLDLWAYGIGTSNSRVVSFLDSLNNCYEYRAQNPLTPKYRVPSFGTKKRRQSIYHIGETPRPDR